MEMLRAEGIRYVFGNPGTAESAIIDGFERTPELEYVLATQEGVAMGMADAYARLTGTVGFVSLHIDRRPRERHQPAHQPLRGRHARRRHLR